MRLTGGLLPRALLFCLLPLIPNTGSAATYYWDTTGTSSWGTAANWSDNATSGGTTGTVPLATDAAFFNQSAVNGTTLITLDGARSILGLTFANTGATTIQANAAGTTGQTLTVGTGGITVDTGAGAVTLGGGANGTTSLTADATQAWTNNAATTLTITAPVAINNALTIGGSGTTTFTGANWSGSGGVTKTGAGTMLVGVNAGDRFTIDSSKGGNFTMAAGTAEIRNDVTYFVMGDNGSTSTFTQTGGTFNADVSEGSYIGNGDNSQSTLTITGGSARFGGIRMRLGQAAGSVGTLNVGGGAGLATVSAKQINFAENSGGAQGFLNLKANGLLVTESLTKGAGAGTLTFDGGTLQVDSAVANGSTFVSGLTAALITNNGATIDTNGKNVTVSQPLANASSATGRLTKTGAGTLTLAAINSYTGGTTVDAGALSLAGNAGNGRISGALTVNVSGTVVTTGDGTGLGFNNQLTSLAINGGMVRAAAGTDSHIFNITGGVNMTGGELQSNGGVSSPTGAAMQWNRTSLTTNASANSAVVSGRVNLRNDSGFSNWAISVADGAAATDLLISAAITGDSVSITKSGSGSMLLSGTNTYTGATTVSAGTLRVNGSLAAASAVSVASGATLGGSGSIAGPVTVNGTLSPGNSPGVISLGSLVLGGTSTTLIEITGTSRGTAYDGIDISTSSGLAYGGILSLDFSLLPTAVADNTTFDIFSFLGLSSGTFSSVTSTGFYSGTWSSVGSGNFELVQGSQTLTFSQATGDIIVVPEPGTLALAVLGLAAGVAAYHRRRI